MNDAVYLMVIAPHPDDSEFGIAGTVARLAQEGKKVVYVICTNGDKGTSDRKLTPEKLAKIREKEQQAAADVLGVSEVVFLGYPDQGLEDTAVPQGAGTRYPSVPPPCGRHGRPLPEIYVAP